MTDPVPVQGGLAPDVEAGKPPFEEAEAGVQVERGVRPRIYTPAQPFEPARPGIVDREVSRDAQSGQLR